VRLESWANAQNQAISVAKALLGKFEPYADIPWFWSDQYDVNLQILGDIPADAHKSNLCVSGGPGSIRPREPCESYGYDGRSAHRRKPQRWHRRRMR